MRNYSTLVYLVNNFREEMNSKDTFELDEGVENSFTSMDFEPSKRSIQSILDFASSYEVLETENTGYVDLNLN